MRLPADWLTALTKRAKQEGIARATLARRILGDGMSQLGMEHSPDDYGVFLKTWRISKRDRRRAMQREYARRHREKKRAQYLAANPTTPIQWTFHPTGQVTTSDLDPLATYVGTIDTSGAFTPESTRYGKDRVATELRKAFEGGDFPDPRYRAFLNREGG